jgi:hypothetical protein
MSDSLKIQVIVDGAQVTAGMANVTSTVEAATSKIKAAFGSVANAPEGIQAALMVLQTSARQSADAVAAATAAINALGQSAAAAAPEVAEVGKAAQAAEVQMTGMDRAMAMATGRVAGMSVGLGMAGGALGRVGAMSETLGPLLAAAFPIIIIGAAVDLLAKLPDLIGEIADKYAGWDKAAQKTYDDLVAGNRRVMEENVRLADQIEAINLIGVEGAKKYRLAAGDNADSIKRWSALNADLLRQQIAIQAQIDKLHHSAPASVPGAEMMSEWFNRTGGQVERLQKQLEGINAMEATVTQHLKELSQVEAPKIKAEGDAAGAKDAEKAAKEAERVAREAARVKHEQTIAELNDEERAVKERTKLLEEEVKANKAADKSMEAEAEKAAKAEERALEKMWEEVVRSQKEALKETEKQTRKVQEQWNQMFSPINHGIDRMINEFMRGNVRVGQIFLELGQSMLTPIVSSFEKALEAQIEYSVTSGQIGKQHALAGILRDAYKAASNVYAEVPFPLNIPAAAGMFATVAALGGGLPSAAGGMETVPQDMLAMIHQNESVIPADYAAGLRNLISAGGGGHTFNYQPTIHAGGKDVSNTLSKSGKQFVALATRELRKMNR